MAQFLLLLHETPADFAALSPQQIQSIIEEYSAWAETLRREERLVDSHKLKDDGGRHLARRDGRLQVTDGPYAEAREVVGGYFLLRAKGYDEAARLAEGCPHLKYGGRIEIRQIDLLQDEA